MTSTATQAKLKRPFNLTLNEGTVEQCRRYTDNLSGTVDALLVEFLAKERQADEEKRELYAKVSEAWNILDEKYGSYGSEFSPL